MPIHCPLKIESLNDLKVTDPDPVIPAAQYFATRGFFHSYDASLHEPLTEAMQRVWHQGFEALRSGALDPRDLAAQVANAATGTDSPPTGLSRGEEDPRNVEVALNIGRKMGAEVLESEVALNIGRKMGAGKYSSSIFLPPFSCHNQEHENAHPLSAENRESFNRRFRLIGLLGDGAYVCVAKRDRTIG